MRSQGEIWLADLNPRHGTEPSKVRPVLVVQNQALLDIAHPSTLVIPLTTNLIDNARLTAGPLTSLDAVTLRQFKEAVNEVLGVDGTALR